jgi:hypothetical protein
MLLLVSIHYVTVSKRYISTVRLPRNKKCFKIVTVKLLTLKNLTYQYQIIETNNNNRSDGEICKNVDPENLDTTKEIFLGSIPYSS